MSSVLKDDEQPDDVTSAENFLARHQEHKAEIDTRQKSVNEFFEAADTLIADGHSASADVKEKKQRLHKEWLALQNTWQEKGTELERSKEVQVFKRDADQLEAWLNARDLDQESGDVGDSLDAVEELIKKHEEFENMVLAQEMKLLGIIKLTPQEQGIHKQKEEENEMRKERERRKKEEEEERIERELREKKRQEELRRKEENDRKEKERKQREEREKLRALEDRKRAEETAKMDEKRKKEAQRQRVIPEEQRTQGEHRNARDRFDKNQNYKQSSQVGSPKDECQASSTSVIEGILQRKQEFEPGAKKSPLRAWKTLYTVLRGHQLFFYREKKEAQSSNYAVPPIDVKDGFCEEASDAARRRNAFRVLCDDDSDYLFVAKDPSDLKRWLRCISEAAGQTDLPSPPPPPQGARPISPKSPPRTKGEESPESPKRTQPYGRTYKPLITVTSFDDDEDVLIDPPPPPPVSILPPSIPSDFSNIGVPVGGDLKDKLYLVEDLESLPLEPDDPPTVPPPDFADFDGPSDDELPVLPTSPPPEFLSDDENAFDNDFEDSSPAYKPSLMHHSAASSKEKTIPTPPPVAPKPEGRTRSDSNDSLQKGPKPPVKPKPTFDRTHLHGQRSSDNGHAQDIPSPLRSTVHSVESPPDDKKNEKKKGVLGNIFKRKK